MTSSCTNSSNTAYVSFWYSYFVSTGDIDDTASLYSPYGKCTVSLLWITYLINLIHFFLLSTGIFYLLTFYRDRIGVLWPLITWIVSAFLIIVVIVLFIVRNYSIKVLSVVIITLQLAIIINLWFTIVVPVAFTFKMENGHLLFFRIFILFLSVIQVGCIELQALFTLHCVYNIKFPLTDLDYSYWSAIIAAIGTIASTILLDEVFVWCQQLETSSASSSGSTAESSASQNRLSTPSQSAETKRRFVPSGLQNEPQILSTPSLYPVIVENSIHPAQPTLYHMYSKSDTVKRVRIQPDLPTPRSARKSAAKDQTLVMKSRGTQT